MSRMIRYLHATLRRWGAVKPPSSTVALKFAAQPRANLQRNASTTLSPPSCWLFGHKILVNPRLLIRSALATQFFKIPVQRTYVTKSDFDDNAPINIVLSEIRLQQALFQTKLRGGNARGVVNQVTEVENLRKLNQSHLEDNVKVEMLRVVPPVDNTEQDVNDNRDLLLETTTNRVPQILANLEVGTVRKPLSQAPVPPPVVRDPRTTPTKPPPPPRQITYPSSAKPVEKLAFVPPASVREVERKVTPSPAAPPAVAAAAAGGPRFLESTTHRIKSFIGTPKSTESVGDDAQSRFFLRNAPSTSAPVSPPPPLPPPPPSDGIKPEVTRIKGSSGHLEIIKAQPVTAEDQLITSVLTKQDLRLVQLDAPRKTRKSTNATVTGGATSGAAAAASGSGAGAGPGDTDLPETEDEDGANKNNTKRWVRLKYTITILGVISGLCGTYLMILIGAPKYDEDGGLLLDKYSHLPIITQYYYRIKDEFENYNKMIKEPSRDKLLPDALEPPYYQPPYTLVLEFTDLLVHPEWTYQSGWRFKKRPGVDQFLEALYTRFEVVVYTAQMGLTVFPIMEALDAKNLISYKLVRDATNFVDGDHVKDLDKINRDLSRVVVVDWNEQSVKLHKDNLFKINRWEGNDDDSTLYDLAAFLIAISEWEVQDVRAVLQYYAQFENPLAKFKENQMQALQQGG